MDLPDTTPQPIFTKTLTPMVGAATWTKEGAWLENSTSNKLRLKFDDKDSQTFVAIEDTGQRSFWQKVKDKFTHVTLDTAKDDGTQESISLNIGSLSKRTQLSVGAILFKKVSGQFTFNYLSKNIRKAQADIAAYNSIIQNGRTRAEAAGKNADEYAKVLQKMILTSMKSSQLSNGIFYDSSYIIQKDKQHPLKFLKVEAELGRGGYGSVHEAFDLAAKQSEAVAVKFANKAKGKKELQNEYTVLTELTEINQKMHIEGIQDPPYCVIDLLHSSSTLCYIIPKYDFSVRKNDVFLTETPLEEKMEKGVSLFNGLNFLHSNQFVHGDIKLDNIGSKNGELQLADFGGARKMSQISLGNPLGIHTELFTSPSDREENVRIYIARLSRRNLSRAKKENLQQDVIQLCKRHDVYCLGRSLLCLFLGRKDEELGKTDQAMLKLRDVTSNSELIKLLEDMLSEEHDKKPRPSIEEATKRYKEIIQQFKRVNSIQKNA